MPRFLKCRLAREDSARRNAFITTTAAEKRDAHRAMLTRCAPCRQVAEIALFRLKRTRHGFPLLPANMIIRDDGL